MKRTQLRGGWFSVRGVDSEIERCKLEGASCRCSEVIAVPQRGYSNYQIYQGYCAFVGRMCDIVVIQIRWLSHVIRPGGQLEQYNTSTGTWLCIYTIYLSQYLVVLKPCPEATLRTTFSKVGSNLETSTRVLSDSFNYTQLHQLVLVFKR